MKTYILVILLGILAVIGWQQANSARYEARQLENKLEEVSR